LDNAEYYDSINRKWWIRNKSTSCIELSDCTAYSQTFLLTCLRPTSNS